MPCGQGTPTTAMVVLTLWKVRRAAAQPMRLDVSEVQIWCWRFWVFVASHWFSDRVGSPKKWVLMSVKGGTISNNSRGSHSVSKLTERVVELASKTQRKAGREGTSIPFSLLLSQLPVERAPRIWGRLSISISLIKTVAHKCTQRFASSLIPDAVKQTTRTDHSIAPMKRIPKGSLFHLPWENKNTGLFFKPSIN